MQLLPKNIDGEDRQHEILATYRTTAKGVAFNSPSYPVVSPGITGICFETGDYAVCPLLIGLFCS